MPTIYYQYTSHDKPVNTNTHLLQHDISHQLLLRGLAELYDLKLPPEELEEKLSKQEYGKPYLPDYPDIFFNTSHCDGLVVCAFGDSAIGIDVESHRHISETLIKRVLTDEEYAYLNEQSADMSPLREEWFLRFWTLKEAYIKKTGTGITVSLKSVSFTFASDSEIKCSDSSICCFQTSLPSGYQLALCYEAASHVKKTLQLIEVF